MANPPSITENDLQVFWRSSRYFSRPLSSVDKNQIEILRRGRHNKDSGPDFLGAAIRVDGEILEGDVELHLDARDWFVHGHHLDPAYNKVILHVSVDTVPPPQTIQRENSRPVHQLLIPVHELARRGLGKEKPSEQMPLLDCPLRREPHTRIVATVQKAGDLRLRQKVDALREEIARCSWDQLLYRGVCEVLGYSKNQQPFRALADLLPIDLLFAEIRQTKSTAPELLISALLFGAAGLLQPAEGGGPVDADIERYLSPRSSLWRHLRHSLQIRPLSAAAWKFFRLRPQNFPTRRLAGVVELVLRFYRKGMLETLVASVSGAERKVGEIIRELRDQFIVPASGFWEHHYDFRSRPALSTRLLLGHLVGENRADDLIINIVLPILFLFANESANATLENRILEIYAGYPALQQNVITAKMHRQLFASDASGRQIPRGACFQQGMLHLHKNFCAPLQCAACLQLTPPAATRERES